MEGAARANFKTVYLSSRELYDIVKMLLMRLMRLHVANAGVAAVMIIIFKVVGNAGLGIG